MADFGLSPASMDDVTYLRVRNTQLETELRFVKEQLAQAQSGTQCILGYVANAHASDQISSANSNERLLQHVQKENEFLRGLLAITVKGNPRPNDLLKFEVAEASPTNTALQSPGESSTSYFNTAQSSDRSPSNESPTTDSSGPDEHPRTIQTSKKEVVGLGIFINGIEHQKSPNLALLIDVDPEHTYSHGTTRPKETKYSATLPHATHKEVASAPRGLWESYHAPPPPEPQLVFDRPFQDSEHNRLMSAACFIEDLTKEGKEKHWKRMSREQGRHSAREWKLYYEKVVQPAYIAKRKKADKAATTLPTRGPTGVSALTEQDHHVERLAEVHGDLDSHKASAAETLVEIPAVKDTADNTLLDFAQDLERSASALPTPSHAAPEVVSNDHLAYDFIKPHQRELTLNHDGQDLDNPAEKLDNAPTPSTLGIGDFEAIASPSPLLDPTIGMYTPETDDSPDINSPPIDLRDSEPLHSRSGFSTLPTKPSQKASQTANGFGKGNPSTFRMLLISNIISHATLAKVVSLIRGGQIVKATFLETNGMKTNPPTTTNAAMIEFLDAPAASAARDHWNEEQAALQGFQSGVHPLTASVPEIPTRKLPTKLQSDMRKRGLSRVFYVVDERHKWTPEKVMEEIMRCDTRQRRPLVTGLREGDVLFFEFADVRHAAMAWEVVDRNQWALRGIKKGFLPDPCEEMAREEIVSEENEAAEDADESEVEDESDGGSTTMNTPVASFEVDSCDD